jgi:hypothetical protein
MPALAPVHVPTGGAPALLSIWQQINAQVSAQTYSNIFLITTAASVLGLFMTFFLRGGRPAPGGEREIIEI